MSGATETTPLQHDSTSSSVCGVAARVRLVTALASLAEGYDIGVINGALNPMKEDLNLSHKQIGIAVGITPLLCAIFALMSGSLADHIGRKPQIALSSMSLLAGSLIWMFAPNFSMLLVARALFGIGIGLGIAGVTIYMSEVAPAHTRGFYASLEEVFISCGLMLGYAAGAAMVGMENDWRIMGGMGAIPAALVVICCLSPLVPESPRYLKSIGRTEEAQKVLLEVLGGDRVEAEHVFALWDDEAEKGGASWPDALVAFCTTKRRMSFAGLGVAVMQMVGGIPVFALFSSYLLISEGMKARPANVVTLLSAICRLVVLCIVSLLLLDRLGRRPLLLLSAGGSCIATAVVGVSYHFGGGIVWLVIGLFLWNAAFGLAMGPVTYVYLGEVFPTELRAKGVSTGLFFSRLLTFVWGFSTPTIYDVMGLHGMFTMLAGLNFVAFLHFYLLCPETTGLTLEQIGDLSFRKKANNA